jgi:hypothetical protein
MHNRESIEKKFKEAGLRLQLVELNDNADIFGLSVEGGIHNEVFVMQPGHETNTVQVLDIDKKEKQVLLHVKEEERTFTTREWDRRKKKYVEVPHKTPANKRKLLLGMDERSYFAAPVAENSINIRDAKERLKNPDLEKNVKTVRQGEWFFQPVKDGSFIEEALRSGEAVINRKVGIGALMGTPGGNPHVVDEIVRVRRETLDQFFARGKVRHVDHKTVEFTQWMRILPNTEERRTGSFTNFID